MNNNTSNNNTLKEIVGEREFFRQELIEQKIKDVDREIMQNIKKNEKNSENEYFSNLEKYFEERIKKNFPNESAQ